MSSLLMLLKEVWVGGKQTTYNQILTEYDKNEQMHVEQIQARHVLEIKKSNAKNHTWLGWWRHWGIGGVRWGMEGIWWFSATQGPYS